VQRVFSGNEWTPNDVLKELQAAIK